MKAIIRKYYGYPLQKIKNGLSLFFSKETLIELFMLVSALVMAFVISKFNQSIHNDSSLHVLAIFGNILLISIFFLTFGLTLGKETNKLQLRPGIVPINITVVLIFSALYLPAEEIINNYSVFLTIALFPPVIVLFILAQQKIEQLIDVSQQKSILFYSIHFLFLTLIFAPVIATFVIYLPLSKYVQLTQAHEIEAISQLILFDAFDIVWEYL